MIKLPTILYTKNINQDEEKLIKLSSRVISLISEEDDANFDIPISFGREFSEFHIVTADKAYDLSLLESNFSIVRDTNTNSPNGVFGSWGRWFDNKWHATTQTKIWNTIGGAWSDTGVTLTTGYVHALEEFTNKVSLAVTNGPSVKVLNTSYVETLLTLPSGYEAIALAFNISMLAIATMQASTIAGQNKEAFLFIWDGSANGTAKGYAVGSDTIMGVRPYKSSFVILTREGSGLYFNGGGFEELFEFPFHLKKAIWGDAQNRETHGDIMNVEGDRIFINVGNSFNSFEKKGERYVQANPAGVWCYDPDIGTTKKERLYHRYAPSISPANQILVTSANINTTTDILTTANTIPATGNPIKLVSNVSNPIDDLSIDTVYFIIRHTATTFSLATTKENAIAGTKIDITSTGGSSNYFTALTVLDYGTTIMGRGGGIGQVDPTQLMSDHLLFGGELNNSTLSTYAYFNITIPRFENRGYIVTHKLYSDNIEDIIQKAYLKYRPLDTNDKIILKYKDKDILGIPTSTPQWGGDENCAWTGTNSFTTTADLSAVETYINGGNADAEVEIISGAGAGSMAQIVSIDTDGTNYSVVLSEDIDGAAVGLLCDISIDNWKVLGTIDSTNTKGWQEFPIATSSKWVQFKVELQGYETTVEELQSISATQIPSA